MSDNHSNDADKDATSEINLKIERTISAEELEQNNQSLFDRISESQQQREQAYPRAETSPIPRGRQDVLQIGTPSGGNNKKEGGRKNDSDLKKWRYDLIPPIALEELAKVYTYGVDNDAARNWGKGIKYGRIFNAIMQHLWEWWRRRRVDKESGLLHLACAARGCFALIYYEAYATFGYLDDRPVEPGTPLDEEKEEPKNFGDIIRKSAY